MDFDLIIDRISSMTFRQSVWLFPLAYFLHVLEELPHFTNWARRYAAPGFTMRDYLMIHLIGIGVALLVPLVIWSFPNRIVIFLFSRSSLRQQFASTFCFTPELLRPLEFIVPD